MKKENMQIKLILERLPRALAAAILSAAISAFVITGLPIGGGMTAHIIPVMILCALFTVAAELTALPNRALLGCAAVFLCAGGAWIFIPAGDVSIYKAVRDGGEITTAKILPAVLLLCGALCLVLCVLNRIYVMRCAAASALLIMLTVLAWLGYSLLRIPAILVTAYILVVLCQVCASGMAKKKDVWFIVFSLLTAVVIFSIPAPSTRIQWEKIFEIGHSETLEQLGETLGVEYIEDDSETGYSEDQSDLGGWIEITSEVHLHLEFSEVSHSDRLAGAMYDRYTGTGWVCTEDRNGMGYGAVSDIPEEELSYSDAYGNVIVTYMEGAETDTLFYPPYTFAVLESGENRYTAYYYRTPSRCVITGEERERFLELPQDLPKRVKRLALSETAECRTDAEKAHELMNLLSGYKYETRLSGAPKGRDFVDYFLFDSKKGYCAHFASTMVIMARCVGIPARYVLGYHVDSGCTEIEAAGSNAHAWAELYIDGAWVVCDPATAPREISESDAAPVSHSDSGVSSTDTSDLRRVLLYSYGAAASAALLFVLFRPALRRLSSKIKVKRIYRNSESYEVIKDCVKLLWTLSACGVKKEEWETFNEFSERIESECQWLNAETAERIRSLFEQTGTVLYSSENCTVTDKRADRAVKKAYIRAFGRGRYLRGYRRALL